MLTRSAIRTTPKIKLMMEMFVLRFDQSQRRKQSQRELRRKWQKRTEEEGEDTFFELRIRVDDLTGENSLIVTDFADDDEVEDAQDLWHAQVDKLRRVLGC